jgi:hypothetical protein
MIRTLFQWPAGRSPIEHLAKPPGARSRARLLVSTVFEHNDKILDVLSTRVGALRFCRDAGRFNLAARFFVHLVVISSVRSPLQGLRG